MQSPADILRSIWTSAGGDATALDRVRLTGTEPQIPSSFRVAVAGQTTIRCRPRRRRNLATALR